MCLTLPLSLSLFIWIHIYISIYVRTYMYRYIYQHIYGLYLGRVGFANCDNWLPGSECRIKLAPTIGRSKISHAQKDYDDR